MNTEQVLEKIADDNKIPVGDVREVYEGKLEETKEAGLQGDQAEERAVKRTYAAFKRQSMSSSTGVEGVIVGAGDRYDAVDYSRRQAIEAYENNPPKAISDGKVALAVPPGEENNITGSGIAKVGEKNGWAIIAQESNDNIVGYDFAQRDSAETDDANTEVEEGWRVYPLDTREKYGNGDPNPRYGTPTPKHQWKRRCTGLFHTGDPSNVQVGQLTLTGKKSMQNPPLGEAVQFKARVNEGDDGTLYVNSTSDTEFQPNPELEEQMSSMDTLLEKYFDHMLYDLDELYAHMSESNGAETVVVKGDVLDMNLEANSNGTYRMVLNQLSFHGGEMRDVDATVWVPEWQDQYIDFAVESTIYVIGRARMQDAYDPQKGQRTSEEQEVVISAQGLYADPVSKIPREEGTEELDEDDMEFETDAEEEPQPEFADGGSDW